MTVTVLSGPERRRRWTTAEKLRIVQESQAPDAMVSEIARRHDVHPNQLHSWRRQARTGVLAGAGARHGAREGTRFAAVAIAQFDATYAACPGGQYMTGLWAAMRQHPGENRSGMWGYRIGCSPLKP